MMLEWLHDLLLESPAPPSNWLPSRAERLADASITLRRRFGLSRANGRPPHHLRDMGSAHPLFGTSRVVSGEEVEADLELDITSINQPIMQGWVVATTVLSLWFVLVGMRDIAAPGTGSSGPALIARSIIGWVVIVLLVAWHQRVIELHEDGVHVRRWIEAWLGRPGQKLGDPALAKARLVTPTLLVLEGELGSTSLRLWLWPHSARTDLVDELPLWGVECEFGNHRHRPSRRRRGRH